MIQLQDYYRGRIVPEAYDLFAVFQRFEYAMKKGGFRQARSANASWRNFAAALGSDFFDRMREAGEARIYFDAPPDHLIMSGDSVDWAQSPKPVTNIVELFDAIHTARNNLFHGDKYYPTGRNRDLMFAALFILNSAYEAAQADTQFRGFVVSMELGH